jgi:hypothetical protein
MRLSFPLAVTRKNVAKSIKQGSVARIVPKRNEVVGKGIKLNCLFPDVKNIEDQVVS